jgi:hypothetical protein
LRYPIAPDAPNRKDMETLPNPTAGPAIEIVEPTLVSEAGHCAALFQGLRAAAPGLRFRLWIDRRAQLAGWANASTELRPLFARRWRKIQALLLFRRLLRAGKPLLVPTASYFDLRALDLAAHRPIPAHRAFLYFHKLRASPARLAALRKLSQRQPHLELFGTSEEIVARLREAGFAHVQRVLPVLAGAAAPPSTEDFRHLLFAGAARADKGFSRIVDLVELLAQTGANVPITVQTSGDHYGRYDEHTLADIERLRLTNYRGLTVMSDTLDATTYAGLFVGAVCLQPYEPTEYADKMSAVTFDALRVGAPIVTLAGTTMARIVEHSGAGIVLEDANPQSLLRASHAAVAQFALLHAKALAAGVQYRPDSSWAPLVERLRLGAATPARA